MAWRAGACARGGPACWITGGSGSAPASWVESAGAGAVVAIRVSTRPERRRSPHRPRLRSGLAGPPGGRRQSARARAGPGQPDALPLPLPRRAGLDPPARGETPPPPRRRLPPLCTRPGPARARPPLPALRAIPARPCLPATHPPPATPPPRGRARPAPGASVRRTQNPAPLARSIINGPAARGVRAGRSGMRVRGISGSGPAS